MKCPKCGSSLIYEDCLEECYDDTTLFQKWLMVCPGFNCDFEGKMWVTYRVESEEWENEESTGEASCVH